VLIVIWSPLCWTGDYSAWPRDVSNVDYLLEVLYCGDNSPGGLNRTPPSGPPWEHCFHIFPAVVSYQLGPSNGPAFLCVGLPRGIAPGVVF